MDNTPNVSNPNDFKVVEIFNSTDFDFTPELGAMFDGSPLFVGSGERRQFPYHVGNRLAINLAKAVLIKGAPLHDPGANNPVGTPLWSDARLEEIKNSFMKELYVEEKPIAQSETQVLLARVAQLEKLFNEKKAAEPLDTPKEKVQSVQEIVAPELTRSEPKVYLDKQEVIAELEKRGIRHDKRQNQENLEKLLA